jgi:hypothetical protein
LRLSLVRAWSIALMLVACGKATQDPSASGPSNRGSVDAPIAKREASDHFEGVISNHRFTITIAGEHVKLASSDRSAYAWTVGTGRLAVSDSGPIAQETKFLVERSPRTIVRGSDGLWVVTEVVTTAGGRMFTCLHQQPIARDGTLEAKQAAARGVAACSSLRVDPDARPE